MYMLYVNFCLLRFIYNHALIYVPLCAYILLLYFYYSFFFLSLYIYLFKYKFFFYILYDMIIILIGKNSNVF